MMNLGINDESEVAYSLAPGLSLSSSSRVWQDTLRRMTMTLNTSVIVHICSPPLPPFDIFDG